LGVCRIDGEVEMGETNLQKHVLELDPGDDASANALLSKIYLYLCLQVRSYIAGENVLFCCCGPCFAIGKMDDNQNLELPAKVWANFSMQVLQT
jgi:hypothetical protein